MLYPAWAGFIPYSSSIPSGLVIFEMPRLHSASSTMSLVSGVIPVGAVAGRISGLPLRGRPTKASAITAAARSAQDTQIGVSHHDEHRHHHGSQNESSYLTAFFAPLIAELLSLK